MTTQTDHKEILFFTAPRCAACKAMRPVAQDVAGRFDGSVRFTEVDSSVDHEAASRHRVRGVPTFVALHEGQEVGRAIGTHSEDQLNGLFMSAESGQRRRGRISPTERALRLGVAALFTVAALAAATPLLLVFALGAAAFATWDLIRP